MPCLRLAPLCLSALSYRLIRMSGSSAYGACFSSCVGRGQYTTVKIAIRSYPPHSSVAFASAYKKHILFLRRASCIPAFRARALCFPGAFSTDVRTHLALPACFLAMCGRILLSRRVFDRCANAPCSPGVFFGNVRAHSAFPAHFRPMCKRTLLPRHIFGQCADAPCFAGARWVRVFREPTGSYAASTAEKTRVARKLYETIICKEDEVWQR